MPRPATLAQLILSLLKKHHALTAKQLGASLKKRKHSYNKTSIYRALEKLVENKQLCKYHFNDEEISYELRQHNHAHLVCQNCGTTQTQEQLSQLPISVDGFSVDHQHLTLFGRCVSCQKKTGSKKIIGE